MKQTDQKKEDARRQLAGEILDMTRTEVLLNMRFLQRAVFALRPARSDSVSLSTDGQRLYYNDRFVLMYYRRNDSPLRIWLHPLMHCLFMHMFVDLSINRRIWDLACDIAAEAVLSRLDPRSADHPLSGMRLTELEAIHRASGGLTAEILYHYLLYEKADRIDEWELLFHFDDHSQWYYRHEPFEGQSRPGRDRAQHDPAASAAENSPQAGTSPKDLKESWHRIGEHVENEAETNSKEFGADSGGLVQALRRLHAEKTDYRDFLMKFARRSEVMQVSDEEFDYIFYHYGMTMYKDTPLIEPLEYSERKRVQDLVIIIDTSGSVQGESVQLFLQKTYNILKEQEAFDRRFCLHLIQADAQIKEDRIVTTQEEFDSYIDSMKLKGFGGTDFRPALDYVSRLKSEGTLNRLKGVLYFTDGHGIYPKKKPDYMTAFIFIDNDDAYLASVPPWAMKVLLRRQDLEIL